MNEYYSKNVKVNYTDSKTGETSVIDIGRIRVVEFYNGEGMLPEDKCFLVTFTAYKPSDMSVVLFNTITNGNPYPIYMTRDRDKAINCAVEYEPSNLIELLRKPIEIRKLLPNGGRQ